VCPGPSSISPTSIFYISSPAVGCPGPLPVSLTATFPIPSSAVVCPGSHLFLSFLVAS
jgi:hypothetical protein